MRVITQLIPFVNSASELLAGSLGSPSEPFRSVAGQVFSTLADAELPCNIATKVASP
jgi:hypothetical protein